MDKIDKKTKELFKGLQHENVPKGFTELIMEQVSEGTSYSPLISRRTLLFAFALFFLPPIGLMFYLEGGQSSFTISSEIATSFTNAFSYKNLELYVVIGILLFWLYFLLENTFSFVIHD